MTSRAGIVALTAVLLAALPGAAPRTAARAEPVGLIGDSLAALDALLADENCVVRDAADNETETDTELPYRLCDDGVPPEDGGSAGIPVPVAYKSRNAGGDWRGLPPPAGADKAAAKTARYDLRPESDGRRITLDVDISLPPASMEPPPDGFPVAVFMHGCCGGNRTSWEAAAIDAAGEKWHHSNAWFAARGYVVVTYTARGFRNSENRGSTGTTQLDSRRFETNDYQYLVGLLEDHDMLMAERAAVPKLQVNPARVAAIGGSYGGGWAWLALTDPRWRSPAYNERVKLAAAVTKYGWTDLVEALVPSGHYSDRTESGKTAVAPTKPATALSQRPIGVEKQSIVAGLYATGNLAGSDHTTFPNWLHEIYARLQVGEPYDGDASVEQLASEFLKDRSAYYQRNFWRRVRNGLRVPLFAAATWTDPLFPTMETVRFYNKLKAVNPGYPVRMYLGDYQHFVANKAKEWGDMCGEDHHVCTTDDFRDDAGELHLGLDERVVRKGINSRMNRFLNFFIQDKGTRPEMRVEATTTTCSSNATEKLPEAEPGVEYRARSWRKLSPAIESFTFDADSSFSNLGQDGRAEESDPVYRQFQTNKCYTATEGAGDGVAAYRSEPLAKDFVMMGIPTLLLDYEATGSDYWIAARLLDETPEGEVTMVTRGVCRVNAATHPKVDCGRFDLWGNGWDFKKDHRVVLELTQNYSPTFRKDNFPSTIDVTDVELEIPVTRPKLRHDFRFP